MDPCFQMSLNEAEKTERLLDAVIDVNLFKVFVALLRLRLIVERSWGAQNKSETTIFPQSPRLFNFV